MKYIAELDRPPLALKCAMIETMGCQHRCGGGQIEIKECLCGSVVGEDPLLRIYE